MRKILFLLLFITISVYPQQKKYMVITNNSKVEFILISKAILFCQQVNCIRIDTIIYDSIKPILQAKIDRIKDSIRQEQIIFKNRREDSLESAKEYIFKEYNNINNYSTFLSNSSVNIAFSSYVSKIRNNVLINWINNNFTQTTFPTLYTITRKQRLLKILDW